MRWDGMGWGGVGSGFQCSDQLAFEATHTLSTEGIGSQRRACASERPRQCRSLVPTRETARVGGLVFTGVEKEQMGEAGAVESAFGSGLTSVMT